MGFRTAYGLSWSENGWRMCDWNECDTGPVPGTNNLRLPIRKGDANLILKGWVAWFNAHVESLANSRGYSDEGSFTWTNSVASSNHLSATAVDLNWTDHPFLVSYGGFDTFEISKVRHSRPPRIRAGRSRVRAQPATAQPRHRLGRQRGGYAALRRLPAHRSQLQLNL